MDIILRFGEIDMDRFRELVDWLEKSPFGISNMDLSGVLQKGDVKVQIVAPKIIAPKPKPQATIK